MHDALLGDDQVHGHVMAIAWDFLDNLPDCTICPWCGYVCEIDRCPDHDRIRQSLRRAARELEEQANAKTPV